MSVSGFCSQYIGLTGTDDTGGTVHVMLSLDDRDFVDEETAARSTTDSH